MLSFDLRSVILTLLLCDHSHFVGSSSATPRSSHYVRRAIDQSVLLENGRAAQKLNSKFSSMTTDSACQTGDSACIAGGFYQCVGGKYVGGPCAQSLKCFALPLLLRKGTSLGCDTEADATTRITDTGATGGLFGTSGPDGSAPSNSSESSSDSGSANKDSNSNANSTAIDSTGMTSGSSDFTDPNSDKSLRTLNNGLDKKNQNDDEGKNSGSSKDISEEEECKDEN